MVAGRAQTRRPLGLSDTSRSKSRARPARRRAPEADPAGLTVRRTATTILTQVVERKSPLDAQLDPHHGNPHLAKLDPRDRSLVRAILGQALRRRGEIDSALGEMLDRPLPPGSALLSAILHVAAAQFLFLDIPDHAAVNLAVAQAGADKRTGRARGLVNGVLRRMVRERERLLSRPDSLRLNTPAWLYERWRATYGAAAADAIAAEHLKTPSLDISVKAEPALWAERLGGTVLSTGSIRLAETQRVSELPGYEEGEWWVQDAAAALPARLFGDVAGKRAADLCAAPGGKTAALAAAGADVTAVDVSKGRLQRLAENLARINLEAHIVCSDILKWQPDTTFDAVLLDAPCTATGTIRRHPDIPWTKQVEDIAALATLQARLLAQAARLVKPGGVLIFSTCSLEPEEGESQIAPFLARHPDFAIDPIVAGEISGLSEPITADGCLRTLPFHRFGSAAEAQGVDGFFAARLRRARGNERALPTS